MARKKQKRKSEHPAEQWAKDVIAGKVPACKWVKLACKRHRRDLRTAGKRGYRFDKEAAQHALDFFGFLKHSKGEWAGESFELQPWQQFIIWVVYGWLNKSDGMRRFRTVYEEVARKNGKSTKLAGVGNYGLVADGEPGAEVYAAATKKDQAKITFDEADRMVAASPALKKRITRYRNNLHIQGTASKFEPLGRDSDSLDGLNTSTAIVDEIHAHKTREIWDVLETSTGARRQPLLWAITTAGFNRLGVGYELRTYGTKILEGLIEDDTFFVIIFTIDEGDDWQDPRTWEKANPNYGITVKPDDMARKCKKAQEIPTALNNFLCKHLNVWTNAETLWVNLKKWKKCKGEFDLEEMRGRPCFGGLDLASTSDIAAFRLVFPPIKKGEKVKTWGKYYLPEDAVKVRSQKNQVPYQEWADLGLFELTPGDQCDYKYIRKDINDLVEDLELDIREIAYDRWNATQLVIDLMDDGATMVPFGQGYASMSAPMKELERLVNSGQIQHGDDPVLNWMASNLVAKMDPAGNIKPDKNKSQEKIDGMVALIMALGRMTVNEGDDQVIDSDYEMVTA